MFVCSMENNNEQSFLSFKKFRNEKKIVIKKSQSKLNKPGSFKRDWHLFTAQNSNLI